MKWGLIATVATLLCGGVSVDGLSKEEDCEAQRGASKEQVLEDMLWGEPAIAASGIDFQTLTLDQCLRLAIVHNLDAQNLRDSYQSSQQDVLSAENFFDLKGALSVEHEQDVYTPSITQGSTLVFDPVLQITLPTAAKSNVIDDDITTLSVPVTKQLSTGASITASPFLRESDFQSNQWSSGINVSVNQPLLDGFGYDVSTATLQSTRLSLEQSRHNLDNSLRSLVVNVSRSYYSVLKTLMILDEQKQALERSMEQLRISRIRKEEGEVAELDVLQADLQVARSENSLISTNDSLALSRLISLKLLIGLTADSSINVKASEVHFATHTLDLQALTDFALNNRVDLKINESSLEQARISRRTARNQNLPDLDLTATYSFVDSDENLERAWDLDQGSVSVGVAFRMPLGDNTDAVRYEKARLAVNQSETTLENTRRQVASEVDNAVRRIETLRSQINVLKKNVEIAEESFRLSKLSYEVGGLISSFDLIRAQDDLTAARTEYVTALIDHTVALSELDLTVGLDLLALIEKQTGNALGTM